MALQWVANWAHMGAMGPRHSSASSPPRGPRHGRDGEQTSRRHVDGALAGVEFDDPARSWTAVERQEQAHDQCGPLLHYNLR